MALINVQCLATATHISFCNWSAGPLLARSLNDALRLRCFMIADGTFCCLSKSWSVKEDIGLWGPVRDWSKWRGTLWDLQQDTTKEMNVCEAYIGFECLKKRERWVIKPWMISPLGTKAVRVMKVNESCQNKNICDIKKRVLVNKVIFFVVL